MSDRNSPLNAENNRGVTNDVMFSYVHTYVHAKINILLSVLSIFVFPFYDLNLNAQGFVYLEFVKYHLDLHRKVQIFRKLQCIHIYFTAVLYTDMSRLSSYIEINPYIFSMLG